MPPLVTATHLNPYFCQEENAANQVQFRWRTLDENWSENHSSSPQEASVNSASVALGFALV